MMVVSSYDLSAPSAEDPPARAGERHRPATTVHLTKDITSVFDTPWDNLFPRSALTTNNFLAQPHYPYFFTSFIS